MKPLLIIHKIRQKSHFYRLTLYAFFLSFQVDHQVFSSSEKSPPPPIPRASQHTNPVTLKKETNEDENCAIRAAAENSLKGPKPDDDEDLLLLHVKPCSL
jgi:hypothetical protein